MRFEALHAPLIPVFSLESKGDVARASPTSKHLPRGNYWNGIRLIGDTEHTMNALLGLLHTYAICFHCSWLLFRAIILIRERFLEDSPKSMPKSVEVVNSVAAAGDISYAIQAGLFML